MAQPLIHTGYRARRGGFGTVSAMVIEQPILIAQANNSTAKRMRLDLKSSLIHLNTSKIIVFIIHPNSDYLQQVQLVHAQYM